MLADMAVNLELSRLITYKAAVDADNGIKRCNFQLLVILFLENIYFNYERNLASKRVRVFLSLFIFSSSCKTMLTLENNI